MANIVRGLNGIKISELGEASQIKDTGELLLIQDGKAKQASVSLIATEREYSEDEFTPLIHQVAPTGVFGGAFAEDITDDTYASSVIIEGKTLVNHVDIPMDVVIPYDYEGSDVTINNTSELGSVRSAVLKGGTIINLMPEIALPHNFASDSSLDILLNMPIKTNEKYFVYIKATHVDKGRKAIGFLGSDGEWSSVTTSYDYDETVCEQMAFNDNTKWLRIDGGAGCIIHNIYLFKERVAFPAAQFWGMKSVKPSFLTTCGANMVDQDEWRNVRTEEGKVCMKFDGYIGVNISAGDYPFRLPVQFKKGRKYRITCNNKPIEHFNKFYVAQDIIPLGGGYYKAPNRLDTGIMNDRLGVFSVTNGTFVADDNYSYLLVDTGNRWKSGYIEKGTLMVTEITDNEQYDYEDYRTQTLTPKEPLELLSPESTLNCITGEVYEPKRRVSNSDIVGTWQTYPAWDSANTKYFYINVTSIKGVLHGPSTDIISNLFKGKTYDEFSHKIDKEGMYVNGLDNDAGLQINIAIHPDKLDTVDDAGVKKYLSDNNFEIICPLAEPIRKTIELDIVEDGQPVPHSQMAFDGTTHIHTSGEVALPIAKNVNPTFSEVLKGRRYTIVTDVVGDISVNGIKMGGRHVVFDDTEDQLAFTGVVGARITRPMIIEGDMPVYDPKYFSGLGMVENPVLRMSREGEEDYVVEVAESDKPLRLHGIEGVFDELNVVKSVNNFTQKFHMYQPVGEHFAEGLVEYIGEEYSAIAISCPSNFPAKDIPLVGCDKLFYYDHNWEHINEIPLGTISTTTVAGDFCICIPNHRTGVVKGMTAEEAEVKWREWLDTKPLLIVYELKTPIIRTVRLTNKLYGYKNGILSLESTSSLYPECTYSAPAGRGGVIAHVTTTLLDHELRLVRMRDMASKFAINLAFDKSVKYLANTPMLHENQEEMPDNQEMLPNNQDVPQTNPEVPQNVQEKPLDKYVADLQEVDDKMLEKLSVLQSVGFVSQRALLKLHKPTVLK